MPVTDYIKKKLSLNKLINLQIVFVVFVYSLMFLAGRLYIRNIIQEYLHSEASEIIKIIDSVLIIFGIILILIFYIIIISADKAKKKTDRENTEKTLQLMEVEKTKEAHDVISHIINASPMVCNFWTEDLRNILTNDEAVRLFDLYSKEEYLERFFDLSPEYQPNGRLSKELAFEFLDKAFSEGYQCFEWMHQKLNGEPIPAEITLVRIKIRDTYAVAGFTRDLREYKQIMKKIERRDNLLNTVNHSAIVLLSTENDENFKSVIYTGMELLGVTAGVDRVHIWKNEMIDGTLHCVHKFRWRTEYAQYIDSSEDISESFPYTLNNEWERRLFLDECINGPIYGMPLDEQVYFKMHKIKSILMIPLFLQDQFWGIFTLDDCRYERTFSEEEVNILRSGGLLIANVILRNEMMQNIRNSTLQLEIALKAAQDANTEKSKFLATMSHEIRTPMNVILGVTENYLEKKDISKEEKEAFEKIYNSGDLLLNIINDILDLSKIEAGKFEIIPVKYEITSLINDSANLSIMKYGSKNIKFILHADENLPLDLFGDELRIKQIINNLLSNAFKYTDSGKVELSFSAEKTTQDKTTLVICVRDTGQGMTTEQINQIFDEYSRFNLGVNRSTVGTGLGMAITNNLVKMMDGVMEINSTPGAGSVFTVYIPQGITSSLLLGKESMEKYKNFQFTDRLRKEKPKIVREPMPYGKVLIVDDMQTNIDVAILLLNPYQLQIDTALSGYEAIDIINSGKVYDIIFMDHMMPKMDGMETTNKLRELGYNHPIIALTANAITGQQEIFLANGFDGYISKPIDIRQLNDLLNRFIRDKKR